jgi:hypothetical protein
MSLANVLCACVGEGTPSLSIQRGAPVSAMFWIRVTSEIDHSPKAQVAMPVKPAGR